MHQFMEKYHTVIIRIITGVAVLLGVFLIVATATNLKEYRYVGAGLQPGSTISVSGTGKVEKAPDTAKFSFTVQSEHKDVSVAQAEVSKKVSAIKTDLLALGIEEKYITTASYNSYPDYQYPQPCYGEFCPTVNSPVLKGYIVSQNVMVSVKDLTKAEGVAGVLGKGGVTSIDGPNFGFEDDKSVSREARDMAILDAQAEAQKLALALGVRLVRVVSFNEQSNGGAMPMYAMRDAKLEVGSINEAPSLPTGVQKIESTVTVVYEIR